MRTQFHDPLIIPLPDGSYLGLSTDLQIAGVSARTSPDCLTWSEPFPLLRETPESVLHLVNTRHFWAPELVKRGETWRLYCCASRPGKTQSVIGLAESADPKGPYTYQGDVIVSQHSDLPVHTNAIDPCVITDREGRDWLIYGSFFGGIRILPLKEDGFRDAWDEGKLIAAGGHRACEGAYCWYDEKRDRYVLFTSWGNLGTDYNIRVAYSKDVDGPYTDSQGFDMTDHDPIHVPGDKIVGGYNFDIHRPEKQTALPPPRPPKPGEKRIPPRWDDPALDMRLLPGIMATGHNSLMQDDTGLYIVHHVRPEGDPRRPFLQIRRMFLTDEGNVMAWPLERDGSPIESADALPERWKMVYLNRFNTGVAYGRDMTLTEMCAIRTGDELTLTAFCKEWRGVVYRQGEYTACTLISRDGEALWGVAL